MEYYSAIKKSEFMNFLGKWEEVDNVIMSEVTQSQKNTHSMCDGSYIFGPGSDF